MSLCCESTTVGTNLDSGGFGLMSSVSGDTRCQSALVRRCTMFPLLFSLIAAPSLAVAASSPLTTPQHSDAPPAIKLWMNSGREFHEGERARVQVESRDDGYVLVFDYDTDGRLRILFPVDPREDNLVRAGRRYEVRGRGDRESFITGNAGNGLVYAAVSPDPFRLEEYQSGGNWDYSRLSIPRDSKDAEPEITELVQRMSTDRGFDYDVLTYRVYSYRDYTGGGGGGWYPRRYPYYGFSDPYYCDPFALWSFWSCRYYRSSVFLGFGFNYYDPFYSSFYPYSYGYYP